MGLDEETKPPVDMLQYARERTAALEAELRAVHAQIDEQRRQLGLPPRPTRLAVVSDEPPASGPRRRRKRPKTP
jgi:hypothetical protein